MSLNFGQELLEKARQADEDLYQSRQANHLRYTLENSDIGTFVGCSQNQIEAIREAQQVAFIPVIYRQYLEVMGQIRGYTLARGDFTLAIFEDLIIIKSRAQWYFESNRSIQLNLQLPVNAFVFSAELDGYLFFLVHEGEDNPFVYYYHEGFCDFVMTHLRLSEWLLGPCFSDPMRWIQENCEEELEWVQIHWSHMVSDEPPPF